MPKIPTRTARLQMQAKAPAGRVRGMSCQGPRRGTAGFTLIELLVVIAILSLLVSILMPSLNRAKFLAKNVICQSNSHQIGLALVTYTSDFRDTIIQVCESPYKGIYNGDRMTPRILADADLLPISDVRGGVWRCPLDERDYKPLFLAHYWYYEGGPGAGTLPDGATDEDMGSCSYATNGTYRYWSTRSPWSYWSQGGVWVPRHYSQAARPTNTIWVHDASSWQITGPDPYTLYYTWITLLYHGNPETYFSSYNPYFRHDPESYGPCGTLTFMDGHVQASIDFLDTFTDENYNYDEALALEWWSFTGE